MTENVRKTFDMLGVEPNQKFKVKCDCEVYNDYYYIDENLKFRIDKEDYVTSLTVLDVIRGDIEIKKIEFTKDEKNTLKGLKLLKFNYIARDQDGKLIAYTNIPGKNYTLSVWQYLYGVTTHVNQNMFDFIKWKDSEPFEIPDFEDKLEYEIDEKKIEEKIIEIYYKTDKRCDDLTCKECPYERCNYIMCDKAMFIDELIANNFTFLKSEE